MQPLLQTASCLHVLHADKRLLALGCCEDLGDARQPLSDHLSINLTLSVQDARIDKVLDFLKAPSQLSDKDLAAKV